MTTFHLWLNTFIATVALGASGASVYYAWQTYTLKTESLGFTVNATYQCPIEFRKIGDEGVLSLCWVVTITNQSESRTSIVRFQALEIADKGGGIYRSGFSVIEDAHGQKVFPPISLGGGEAQQYLMRVPASVPGPVAVLVDSLPAGASQHQLQSLTLKSSLDIIGNKVAVRYFDEQQRQASVSWIYGMRVAVGEIRFFTGRGNMFAARMSFPPILHAD